MKKYIKDTLNYYDMDSKKYRQEWNEDFSKNYQFDVPKIFLSYLKSNSYILDLGCGTGRDSKYFFGEGHRVKCIDGSIEMCRIASRALGIEVERLNFLDIDYTQEFDGVFACMSLLHLNKSDLVFCLKKISEALKNGGIFYVSFKLGEEERFSGDRFYNDMTEDKFRKICEVIPEFCFLKVWETSQYQTNEKLINFIICKNRK